MGLKDIVKGNQLLAQSGDERKRPNMVVVWIIIIGVLILCFSGMGGRDDKKGEEAETRSDFKNFEEEQEKKLETILKKINGAGDVTVFISVEGGGEKILARNNKSKLTEEISDKGVGGNNEETESQVVVSGKSSSEEPYVVEEKTPKIGGVLVVAEGAGDERVRVEIYDAVKAIYGVAAHRIKVAY